MATPLHPDGASPSPSPGSTDGPLALIALELTRDPSFCRLLAREGATGVTGTTAAEIVVADIAARLRPACSHLADADFAALVLDLVRMKIRLATIDDRWVQETNGVVPPVDG
jgi:hypothetical protein